jgi:hypothetical protein
MIKKIATRVSMEFSRKCGSDALDHKLRKREDWTVRRIFLSLLIDHMMTKYIIVI